MTDEEKKAKQREYHKRWNEAHPGYQTAYMRKYRQEHREQWNERCRNYQRKHREAQQKRMNDYHKTRKGRATNLLNSYVQADLERRGVRPDLTQDDIMRKCFEPGCKCIYCGETSWRELGLDRINNDLPHDTGNCVCCCHDCNTRRYVKNFGEYIKTAGFGTFEDWMKFAGATYAPDTITLKYPEKP